MAEGKQVIAEIRPQIIPTIEAQISIQPKTTQASLRGSLIPGASQVFWDHINNHNNPHETTAAQVEAVPIRLQSLLELTYNKVTPEVMDGAQVYVDYQDESYRMSLGTIKALNTKTVITDDLENIDTTQLVAGDHISISI